jgi:hypothetical protein
MRRLSATTGFLDKGSQVYNVKAYGAKGDGTTSDAAAIQSAIDAAYTAGGGTVLIPEGTYSISTTVIHKTRVKIIGDGIGVTILKLANGANVDVIQSHNFNTYTDTNTRINDSNLLTLEGLTVDGNKSNNTLGSGAKYYAAASLFKDLYFYNCAVDGFYTEWANTSLAPTIGGENEFEARYVNVNAGHNGQDGIVHRGPHDSSFVNCISHHNTRYGIYVVATSNQSAAAALLTDCHIWGSHTIGLKVGDTRTEAASVIAVNCQFESTTGTSVELYTDQNRLRACDIFFAPVGLNLYGKANIISDCDFNQNGTALVLGRSGAGEHVSGNRIDGRIQLTNRTGGLAHASQIAINNANTANAENVIDVNGSSTDVSNVYVSANETQLLTNNTCRLYFFGSAGTYKKASIPSSSLSVGSLALTTDLPLTEGGTGASDAASARSNLGLGNVPNVDATARANHTGSQAASTISDFSTAADARIAAAAGSTVASLSGGKVPSSQLPAVSLATVQMAVSQAAQLALTTQEGDIVVRTDENSSYMRNAGTSGTMADFTLIGVTVSAPGQFDLDTVRKRPILYSDFLVNTTNASPFQGLARNTGTASGTNAPVSANHPGVLRLSSSTSADSGYFFGVDTVQLLLGGGESFEAIFQVATTSGTTIRLGFHDTTAVTDAVDGAYIEISGTTLSGKTASNSTRSTTGTNYTISTGSWYRARITVAPGAGSVSFAVYNDSGTLLWSDTLSTNIPTAAGRLTGLGIIATNSGTTAVGLIDLDYMAVTWSSDRTR